MSGVRFDIGTAWKTDKYREMAYNGNLPVVEIEKSIEVEKTSEEILNEILQMESGTP